MPGPGTGRRPGGWETLTYVMQCRHHRDKGAGTRWAPELRSKHSFPCFKRLQKVSMAFFTITGMSWPPLFNGSTRCRSWKRHYPKMRKVPGSILNLEFLIDIIIPGLLWSGVDSDTNRNEFQEYFVGGKGGRCVGLTTLPPSSVDCLWNLDAWTSWNPQGLSRPVMGFLYLLELCLYWNCNINTVFKT